MEFVLTVAIRVLKVKSLISVRNFTHLLALLFYLGHQFLYFTFRINYKLILSKYLYINTLGLSYHLQVSTFY